MQPTILCGDVVLVNKLAYDLKVPFTKQRIAQWSDPTHGDIVVCFSPADGTRLVKRVVAVPGDTIEMRRNTLFLNGTALDYLPMASTAAGARDLEPNEREAAVFAREQLGSRSHGVMAFPRLQRSRDFGPVRVPLGQYFMMGDNRDNSNDSRYFGFISREEIVGEAEAVLISGDLAHWLRPRFARFFTKLD